MLIVSMPRPVCRYVIVAINWPVVAACSFMGYSRAWYVDGIGGAAGIAGTATTACEAGGGMAEGGRYCQAGEPSGFIGMT